MDRIRMKFEVLAPVMDERLTRLWAAAEAEAYGRGGNLAVTQATGILGKRILAGKRDLAALRESPPTEAAREQRIRKPGAGRKRLEADGGGSNGSRTRLWKLELQGFADESQLRLHVSHYPPGTSKWNKIEHRMFCHITQNWRGRPLESLETVVNLIGSTTTAAGLRIRASLDAGHYEKGIVVTDDEMAAVNLQPARLRGEWSYLIAPGNPRSDR